MSGSDTLASCSAFNCLLMRSFRARASADPPPSPGRPQCGGNQSRPCDDEWTSLMLFICLLFTLQSGKMRGQQQTGKCAYFGTPFPERLPFDIHAIGGRLQGVMLDLPLNHSASSITSTEGFLDLCQPSREREQASAGWTCRICQLSGHTSISSGLCALSLRFACRRVFVTQTVGAIPLGPDWSNLTTSHQSPSRWRDGAEQTRSVCQRSPPLSPS